MKDIFELKRIRDERRALEEKEAKLLDPDLKDWSSIAIVAHLLYEWSEVEKENDKRRQVMYILFDLYCPSVLIGDKIPSGLRKMIAKGMNISNQTYISDNVPVVVFFYQTYPNFRSRVAYLYDRLLQSTEFKEILFKEELKGKL